MHLIHEKKPQSVILEQRVSLAKSPKVSHIMGMCVESEDCTSDVVQLDQQKGYCSTAIPIFVYMFKNGFPPLLSGFGIQLDLRINLHQCPVRLMLRPLSFVYIFFSFRTCLPPCPPLAVAPSSLAAALPLPLFVLSLLQCTRSHCSF